MNLYSKVRIFQVLSSLRHVAAVGIPQVLVGVKWSPSFYLGGEVKVVGLCNNGGRASGIMAEVKDHWRGRGKCKPREGLYKGSQRERKELLSDEGVIM